MGWESLRRTGTPLPKHLVESLDKFKVPQKEKDDLMAFVGTLKKDIVENNPVSPITSRVVAFLDSGGAPWGSLDPVRLLKRSYR